MHFLFRDAAHKTHPDEPPTNGRVWTWWLDFLEEVERRIKGRPRDAARRERQHATARTQAGRDLPRG
jgi:hypothetical protein